MKKKHLMEGIGVLAAVIAIAILLTVAVIGIVIQKKDRDAWVLEEKSKTTTIAEPTERVKSPTPTTTQKTITASESTNAKLDEDFSAIDSKMKAIDADEAAIDAGLNDQMGDLSE